jgi:hypothetical protein
MSGAVPNILIIGSGFVAGGRRQVACLYRLALGISSFFLFHHEHGIRMITQALFYSLDYLVLIFVIHSHLWLYHGRTNSRRLCSDDLRHSKSAEQAAVVTLDIPHCSISQIVLAQSFSLVP